MKRWLFAAAFVLALAAPATAQQTLPPNTVWGRIGAGQSGPPEAIPFATLSQQLISNAGTIYGGPAAGSSLTLQSTSSDAPAGDSILLNASTWNFNTLSGANLMTLDVSLGDTALNLQAPSGNIAEFQLVNKTGTDGVGSFINFQNNNSIGSAIDGVQLNGGLVSAVAGNEQGDLDFGIYVNGTTKVVALSGPQGGTAPFWGAADNALWDLGRSSAVWNNAWLKNGWVSSNLVVGALSSNLTTPALPLTVHGATNENFNAGEAFTLTAGITLWSQNDSVSPALEPMELRASEVLLNGVPLNLGVANATTGTIALANSASANSLTLESASVASASRTITFPDPGANDSVAYLAASQTLTNKTINGSSNTISNIGNASLTNSVTTVAGQTCTLGSTCGLSKITNSLSSNVNLNNTTSFIDGPSVAQGTTGTWFVSGSVTLLDTAGAANILCKLWDGSTTMDASGITMGNANWLGHIALSGYLASPAGNIRISCKDVSSTSGSIQFNQSGTGMDSTISAVRIN